MKALITILMQNLSGMLKFSGTRWSATRFAFLFAVILSNLCIFGLWVVMCILKQDILPIDNSVVVLYAVANGISFGGKVIQKNMEPGQSDNKPTPPPENKPITP